jgi:acetyl esterase/lipase
MFVRRSPLLFTLAALALVAPARVEAQDKKGPALPEGTKVETDLAYGPHKERNVLDLYLPKSEAPLPLVIWVHGGGWQNGSKGGGGPALGLLAKGYAVASINYRLSQHAVYPAQIEDCKAAVRFLRANALDCCSAAVASAA